MIPIKADTATREFYVSNIITAWQRATQAQRVRGAIWYQNAHELALLLADGDAYRGAGVIAALSANKAWTENQKLATQAFAGNVRGHTGATLTKVAEILDGVDPVEVLPMALKTGNFFRTIADPTDPDAVVIDRHAHDVAVHEIYGKRDRGLSNANRYALLAHCYREAALRLGELPSTVQAVTWIAHIERNKGGE